MVNVIEMTGFLLTQFLSHKQKKKTLHKNRGIKCQQNFLNFKIVALLHHKNYSFEL